MDSSTVIWIIIGVIVALVVIAAVVALGRRASARKAEHNRQRAGELREQAAATEEGIRRHQAEVAATEARARELRAEADRKQAEAKRVEAEVRDRRSTLTAHVQRRDEALAEADELDPDVEPDSADRADSDEPAPQSASGQHRS
jgi:type VI protein secretion system component VasK